jgi:hypothetical protein
VLQEVDKKLGPECEQNIEDELSTLHKSLIKAYRKGSGLNVFNRDSRQNTNLSYWAKTSMREFLEEYDTWERANVVSGIPAKVA